MNKVLLVGRLTRDPELRTTPGGMAVTRFTLAVSQNFTNKNISTTYGNIITINFELKI